MWLFIGHTSASASTGDTTLLPQETARPQMAASVGAQLTLRLRVPLGASQRAPTDELDASPDEERGLDVDPIELIPSVEVFR